MKLVAFFVALAAVGCCYGGPGGLMDDNFISDLRTSSWKMYTKLIDRDSTENFVFSPLSIQHVLGMIAAGAEGETKEEILNALNMSYAGVNYDIFEQFRLAKLNYFEGIDRVDYPSRLANKAYIAPKFTVKPTYTQILSESFGASYDTLNVMNPSQASRTINQWVSDRTESMIKKIVEPSDINALTRMFLVNALFFKARWVNSFVESRTDISFDTGFRNIDVSAIETTGEFYYIDESGPKQEGMQYFAIPYDIENMDVYFVIACPKRAYRRALKGFELRLSKHFLVRKLPALVRRKDGDGSDNENFTWKRSRTAIKDTLKMPKFNMEKEIDAVEMLEKMAVTRMFQPGRSELGGITDAEDLYVSSFKHSAIIQVDEKGTTAAAATAAGIGARTFNRFGEKYFVVDQPYFFGIFQEGAWYFMGTHYDPRNV